MWWFLKTSFNPFNFCLIVASLTYASTLLSNGRGVGCIPQFMEHNSLFAHICLGHITLL